MSIDQAENLRKMKNAGLLQMYEGRNQPTAPDESDEADQVRDYANDPDTIAAQREDAEDARQELRREDQRDAERWDGLS